MADHDPPNSDDTADLAAAYAPKPSGDHLPEDAWNRLFEGSWGPDERARAFDHIVTCRTCADIFRGLKTFEREAPSFDPQASVPARNRVAFRVPPWTQALAAMLAVGVAGWLTTRGSAPVAPPAPPPVPRAAAPRIEKPEIFIAAEHALVMRGGQASGEAYLEKLKGALEPYGSDKFAEAAVALADLGRAYPDAVEPPLYEGVSRLLLGQAGDAVAPLERASGLAGAELKDIAAYHLALARLGTGDAAKARAILAELCGSRGRYQEKACRALDQQR